MYHRRVFSCIIASSLFVFSLPFGIHYRPRFLHIFPWLASNRNTKQVGIFISVYKTSDNSKKIAFYLFSLKLSKLCQPAEVNKRGESDFL